MQRERRVSAAVWCATALLVLTGMPRSLGAQVDWRPGPVDGEAWVLEATWSGAESGRGPGLTDPWPVPGTFVLAGRHPLGAVDLRWDVPIATVVGRTDPCVDGSCREFVHGTVLGNPRIGVQSRRGPWTVGLSTRMPLQGAARLEGNEFCCDRQAADEGLRTERHDRLGAFLHEVWTLRVHLETTVPVDAGRFVFRGGWERLDHLGDEGGDLHRPSGSSFDHWTLAAHFWGTVGRFTVGGGTTGRYWHEFPADRFRYDLGIAAEWNRAGLRPFLSARTLRGLEGVGFGDRWRIGLGFAR